jgi:sulfur-carrier protein adenylyltransferase/sulfurtransferase
LESTTITAQLLRDRLQLDEELVIVDVRNAAELREGHIPGAIHLPLQELEDRARELLPNHCTPTAVYCAQGMRSVQALRTLQQLGYERVMHLESGFANWQALGLPVEIPAAARSRRDLQDRYSRQLLLAQVGPSGQDKLSRARVLLIGVGGLGSPAALYLAGAGVGTLGLVDPDVVDISNLHRQIIHDTSRVGSHKVESARAKITAVNPDVKVETFAERFCSDNADRIVDCGWDVVVDGADNFETRYMLNDIAVRRGLAVCHGSIDRFEGRVTTFLAQRGPCYRCLFPRAPQPGTIGSCAERGVLGVLPGVIGILQATEAIKLILGVGQPLSGRLLTYDALELEFHQIRYRRDPRCPVCAAGVEEA